MPLLDPGTDDGCLNVYAAQVIDADQDTHGVRYDFSKERQVVSAVTIVHL